MRSGLCLPVLSALLAWPWACVSMFQAQQPLSRAEGTWTGAIEPVQLTWHRSGRRTTNIYMTIDSGPPAREVVGQDPLAGPMVGRHVVLFDTKGNPIEWQSSFANRRARVTGVWDSQSFRLGGKLGWAIATRPDGERVDFSPLEASQIEWLSASASKPASAPAPTTAASPELARLPASRQLTSGPATSTPAVKLTAVFVRVPSSDIQTKLAWTPVAGAKNYRVDFSSDGGKTFYDAITTDSTVPDATLDNTPDEDVYVRVAALDAKGTVLATSNLLKLIPETGTHPARAVPATQSGP